MRTLEVTKLRDLTGPGHTDEYGIGGTDLGAAATAPDGRIVAVFGDTFESKEAGGPGWRSPVILFGDPDSVRSGLRWTGAAGPSRDYADQVVSYRHNARIGGRLGGLIGGTRITTQLPTDLITVGDTMYLHVMACEGLGNVHWTEIHRSRDNGVSWESTGLSWPGGHLGGHFQMLTWELGPDGYVYALHHGVPAGQGPAAAPRPRRPPARRRRLGGLGVRGRRVGLGEPADARAARGVRRALAAPGRRTCGGSARSTPGTTASTSSRCPVDRRPTSPPPSASRSSRAAGGARRTTAAGAWPSSTAATSCPGSTPDEMHLVVSQWHTNENWPYRAMHFRARLAV